MPGVRLDRDQISEPFADWRRLAGRARNARFDGGYARRIRRGPRRISEILTAPEKSMEIWVFASAHKAVPA